jgi:hypothetical protein
MTIGMPSKRRSARVANHLDPVHVRHVEVTHHEVDGSRGQLGEPFDPVRGADHAETARFKREADHVPDAFGVIDRENCLCHFRPP